MTTLKLAAQIARRVLRVRIDFPRETETQLETRAALAVLETLEDEECWFCRSTVVDDVTVDVALEPVRIRRRKKE